MILVSHEDLTVFVFYFLKTKKIQSQYYNLSKSVRREYQFCIAAITNYHKCSGLALMYYLTVLEARNSKLIGSHWAKIKVSSELVPPGAM